jgi:hypothetical protein
MQKEILLGGAKLPRSFYAKQGSKVNSATRSSKYVLRHKTLSHQVENRKNIRHFVGNSSRNTNIARADSWVEGGRGVEDVLFVFRCNADQSFQQKASLGFPQAPQRRQASEPVDACVFPKNAGDNLDRRKKFSLLILLAVGGGVGTSCMDHVDGKPQQELDSTLYM